MLSDETKGLIYHCMDVRDQCHPSDREIIAELLARIQSVHNETVALESDIGRMYSMLTDEPDRCARSTGS